MDCEYESSVRLCFYWTNQSSIHTVLQHHNSRRLRSLKFDRICCESSSDVGYALLQQSIFNSYLSGRLKKNFFLVEFVTDQYTMIFEKNLRKRWEKIQMCFFSFLWKKWLMESIKNGIGPLSILFLRKIRPQSSRSKIMSFYPRKKRIRHCLK